MNTKRLIKNLELKIAFHRENQNDPYNIGTAAIAILSEFRHAIIMAEDDSKILALDFVVTEKVKIKELNRNGIVIALFHDGSEVTYKVRYFDDAEAKEVYFYEWELE